MRHRYVLLLLFLALSVTAARAQREKNFEINSPNKAIKLTVEISNKISWSVNDKGQEIIAPSFISLELENGTILGENAEIISSNTEKVDSEIHAINYIKSFIPDSYEQLTINFKDEYGIIFRVFNDAVAYRFFTRGNGEIVIKNEEANFNFTNDDSAFIPYMRDYRDNRIFNCSFESHYTQQRISEFKPDSLAFLPVLVDVGNGRKVVILEADLENYPGMFLDLNKTGKGFKGVYAPYPLKTKLVGYDLVPIERADYIAKVKGTRNFPWRIIAVSEHDKDLLNNNIVQKLASPPRIKNLSWIKPGQVSWDWWNDWNISHVNFKAGINTSTYKYYTDFASANHIPYIIMDEGWSIPGNLTKTQPAIDLLKIIKYGKEKGVGVILWAKWHLLLKQIDQVFLMYSKWV